MSETQTAIEKLKAWILTCPAISQRVSDLAVDFTEQDPANGGIFPSGISEISRKRDITGKIYEIVNQYNFSLYMVLLKSPGDNSGSKDNAEFIQSFQEWIREQSAAGSAPVFGDVADREVITAQNGVLYDATDEGVGTYMVQISVKFVKRYS